MILFCFLLYMTLKHLNKDLKKINNWAFQWKMNFNSDPTKQAHEVIFTRKAKEIYHPPLVFNNTSVSQSSSQKHLGVTLDSKLIFDEHLKMVSLKIFDFFENYITCYQDPR